ncbi:Zinc finger, CCCH-type [Penicillium expansum]|uniref:Zinc finger, CCCH-type n=1 Tax=Penicillium expansum TaxID=27334 RepID=A0A0A2I5W5_PENEN|nr:Zinc finger, CCCH-type [Penicillium expansum]KGO37761.1 Zinc finger, CCCH-type [Penicillium expansum]KGO49888.1 Zinc finger, CCCH-type [Penicillium expansum]KGO70862.1 Zinc finger, CCCH-type [Penicillium expansum]
MATPSRPQFFCTRPDGTLTPLVAVDELPSNVTIRGVSRTLNAGETQGMTSCGLATQRSEPWSVDGVAKSSDRESGKEALPDMHSLLLQILTNKNVPEAMRASAQAILFQGVDSPRGPGGQGTPANGLSPIAPTFYAKNSQVGNKHTPSSKKEYCSYWIRHGECDYSQQGCLYKHEMPTEFHMIEKLGLRDIPRWYREKHNVQSFLHPNRTQLAIAPQQPMRALPSPDSPTDESCAGKMTAINANPKLNKSPPRGPANRGGYNGFVNHNQHRGGGRTGAPNGHHNNNWKGTHRGGRNRTMGPTRHGINGEREGERSGECSPGMESAPATYHYGSHGYGGNQVCTPTTPAAVPATVPITVSTTSHVAAPMAAHQSLLDDGNSLNRNAYWKLNELTDCNQDVFEEASNKLAESYHRIQPRHMYQNSSNPSSDGGVMLPKEPAVTYDPNFSAFARVEIPSRKQSDSSGSHSTVQMSYGPSTPHIGDLQLADNVPLNLADTCVTWGPIGGPILKRTSPPVANIAHMFGSYSNSPRSN